MRLAIPPPLAIFDPADGALLDAVFSGDFALKSPVAADRIDLREGKFGGAASLPSVAGPVLHSVMLICRWRVPPQIIKHVVKCVAVVVAALHAHWARANESFQNKNGRLFDLEAVPLPKTEEGPVFCFARGLLLDAAGFYRSHLASVRDFIKAFKPDNWFPYFHRDNHTLSFGISQ